ncbi:MAG: DNA-binding MarR family transcriptional regulator [Granulosicoccus sp.]|jgi:DNA-binding MarR family transcriptional regulator
MSPNSNQMPLEDASKTRLRLWLRLLKVSRGIEGKLRENLRAEFDSTLPRFDVLAALFRYPKGMKMSELSGVLKVSNGNVTGIVDRLVQDGSIIRSPVPGDRRALLVRLTKRGKEEFNRQAEQHEQWVSDLLSSIPLDEAEKMMQLLELANLTAHKKDD